MKKIIITFFASVLVLIGSLRAQTVQDGINFLYEEREQSAKGVFDKLLEVNPNNIEATYWLGQTYIAMDNIPAARQVYEKALAASANAPLLIVGLGHVELLENKPSDARQRFETAITMTHTKKGDDPDILNAIGRANVDAKAGDLAYAIDKLEAAAQRNSKNPDIFLNLGNAYRKARPGENGGLAYTNYKKAIDINPNFAIAYYRIAKLFETQQNWDLFIENLDQTVAKDPGFGPAYYDLYYYYLLKVDPSTGKIDFAKADDYAKKYIANTDPDVQNDYLRAQTLWAQKNYNEAISIAQGIVSKAGDKTLPRTYKLLAYCFVEKGDTLQAKNYIDQYFAKEKPEKIIPLDYLLKANIYSGVGNNPDAVVKTFIEAANADTTITGKINLLKRGADLMKTKGNRAQEANLRELIFKTNPSPSNLDIFNWGLALFFDSSYARADSVFGLYSAKYPDQTFGWQWQFNSERQMDTSMEKGLAVPIATKYLELLAKDSLKNKTSIMGVAGYLAQYYANIAKDATKALVYINEMLALDPGNANLNDVKKSLEDSLKKPAPNQKNTNGGNTSNQAATNGNKQ
ncbi:MAG TPA: tetratricopeptide repeat protein [Chitinophagaceae bacterium]|nr:tetratricopeptide repeat protein [Chitinophagaceae bacterium]